MLISPDEIVTGALVNAIAAVARQITKEASGLRKPDVGLETARWFETFRLTETLPDLPELSPASAERLAAVLSGAEIQAALQELLATRLTDAPEINASRARDAIGAVLSSADSDATPFAGALADYYDDQICSLVARLEAQEPPVLPQIRSEAFSSRLISVLHAIERNTTTRAGDERQGGDARTVTGQLLADVTDPFTLEVHRPVQVDNQPPGLPTLPTYVPREHDRRLAQVVQAAAEEGTSGVAALVGGSSTGKTRGCWEALRLLRERPDRWRLWHPINPSRPEAALRELPSIGPRTVIWLNEAQFYLDVAAGGLGERVAAGLRELLRDPARAPVLVLATMWPHFWDRLTARPLSGEDPHAQARELLTGRDITVPAAFTATELPLLAAAGDPRLVRAAAAPDGRVIQFLAGIPELTARYRNAPPTAAAVMAAAMDARRLGMGAALPQEFLEAAAPGYLTDDEWRGLDDGWLNQALAYTAADCKGTRGPLTPIRPRLSQARGSAAGPAWRLADYLDQHGRRTRRAIIPPAEFWIAAARSASLRDLDPLASAAENRGLLRDAACLRKRAAADGNLAAAASLIESLHTLHPADSNPARWAAAHTAFDDASAVAILLSALWKTGAVDQVAVLAERAAADVPLDDSSAVAEVLDALTAAVVVDQVAVLAQRAAANVTLADPRAVAILLRALTEAGAVDEVAVLAERAAANVPLDSSVSVEILLRALTEAGAVDQVAVLAERAAADAPLTQSAFEWLLEGLREAGTVDQMAVLAERAATQFALNDPSVVAQLLDTLRRARASGQVMVLAERAAAHLPLDNPQYVAWLLNVLLENGTADHAAGLLARDPAAHVSVNDLNNVHWLLRTMWKAGAVGQVTALAERAAADAPLDEPSAVANLLSLLRQMGAASQAATLLARDPAVHASPENHGHVAILLKVLHEAGAAGQVTVLAKRVAAHAPLDDSSGVGMALNTLRKVGATDELAVLAKRAALYAPVDDAHAVTYLLKVLHRVGAASSAATLGERAAAHASLDDPYAVAHLLGVLDEAGAAGQVTVLAERAAAHVPLDQPHTVIVLLRVLREAGAAGQATVLAERAAAHVPLDSAQWAASLLKVLGEAGAAGQVTVLAERAAAHAPLDDPSAVARLLEALTAAGAASETANLLARDPAAHASLDDPDAVAHLLEVLRKAGAAGQLTVLAERAAAHTLLDQPRRVAAMLKVLREAGAAGQVTVLAERAAVHAPLDDPQLAAILLGALREAGAADQAEILVNRLPAEGMFRLFREQANHQVGYRFGREPDGRATRSWGWNDLTCVSIAEHNTE